MRCPRVSIIILNWNGWKDTIECLESLYQINYPNYDVIVVDNGSKDDSVQKIKEYCEGKVKVESKFFRYNPSNKPIYVLEYTRKVAEKGGDFGKEKYFSKLPSNRKLILILNEKNYGFAEGNNIGIRYVLRTLKSKYILLLNNDTVVDKNFLNNLVIIAESDPKIGVVGPKIYFYDKPETINFAGGKIDMKKCSFPHIGINKVDTGKNYNKITNVDYIDGSCFLIKKEIINKVGLLDPVYFCYVEEIDWCIRIRHAGYKIIYVPTAKIWHKGGSSSGGNFSCFYIYYKTRNRLIFIRRYGNLINFITATVLLTNSVLLTIISLLTNKNYKLSLDIAKSFLMGVYDSISVK